MNELTFMGRIATDLELNSLTDGKAIITFNIAVQRDFKNKEGAYDSDFFQLKAFGKTAEFISQYFSKGKGIIVTGTIKNNNYEKDGVKIYKDEIIISKVKFPLQNKQQQEGTTPANQNTNQGPASFMKEEQVKDEDLPF